MNKRVPVIATFHDQYGEEQHVIAPRRGVLAVRRQRGPTPLMAINAAIQAVVMRKAKALREERGWTLKQMSERMGHMPPDKSRMWALENMMTEGFSIGTIYTLCIALDVDVAELLPSVKDAVSLARVEMRGDALKLADTNPESHRFKRDMPQHIKNNDADAVAV